MKRAGALFPLVHPSKQSFDALTSQTVDALPCRHLNSLRLLPDKVVQILVASRVLNRHRGYNSFLIRRQVVLIHNQISRSKLLVSKCFRTLTLLLTFALASSSVAFGLQTAPEPRRELLLNGLRVLVLSQPSSPNVTIALRIHSGSAFDLKGKEGTMALFSDLLFPDPETRDFFTDELGGSLRVTIDYDSVNIQMVGRTTEFERMLEILRTALISTPITDQNFAQLRDARIKSIRDMNAAPANVADRTIARRLFGDYPYGRSIGGTLETLSKIDRPDLLLARERFCTPDNSTLVVIGGVQESRVLRASRQLLGAWRKSDKLVPSTFRMPDSPDSRTLLVDASTSENVDVRLAVRSVARADRDYPVAALLTRLMRARWMSTLPESSRSTFFVRNESYLLSGIVVMGGSSKVSDATKILETAKAIVRSVIDTPPTASELERVRNEELALLNKSLGDPSSISEMWLDAETYKLAHNGDQISSFSKVTPADFQRVAVRLFGDAAFATIAVGNAIQIRTDFERIGKVEVFGENLGTQPASPVSPSKNP